MEEWEPSGRTLSREKLIEIYWEEFFRPINVQAETTPNFDFWFGSGPYSGPVDIERRIGAGEIQLIGLLDYCESVDESIWGTPGGDKAIGLEINVALGGVMVRGFIDHVVEISSGLIVRNTKTGSKLGGSDPCLVASSSLLHAQKL